jgi:molybdenum transport protein
MWCDDDLQRLLREDTPHGDLTTTSLGIAARPGRLTFAARGAMRVAGIEAAQRLFELAGAQARCRTASGQDAVAGALLLQAEGSAEALHRAWKVAQTLVEVLSGIATGTAAIVGLLRAHGFEQPVACTRKTFPGTRLLAAQAVRAGGGVMHRLGLSETLLVFPEHRLFLHPVEWLPALQRLRAAQPEKRLVVEVGEADEAFALAQAGVEVLQLERFSPADLAALRERLAAAGLRPVLAPAGGVTVHNALDYARAGADLLVSSAPYHAPPADVKVTFSVETRQT